MRGCFAVYFTFFLTIIISAQINTRTQEKIKGVTMVLPPKTYDNNPFTKLRTNYANWTSLVPFGFCNKDQTDIIFNESEFWWGLTEDGLLESISKAKSEGLKIMIKPQLFVEDNWPGVIEFENEEDWLTWEKNYRDFILFYLNIAACEDIEIFCLGTELKLSIQKRPQFWLDLIAEARKIYNGKLIYSANWDSYHLIPFWDKLDYIGISAYFPLLKKDTPKINQLIKAWKPIKSEIKKYSKKYNKKIIFTEFGYLSVDGGAFRHWELEKKLNTLNVNEQVQSNAIIAMFNVFWDEDFWEGGFLWKWYPEGQHFGTNQNKDYTPQNKLAEQSIKDWFRIHP